MILSVPEKVPRIVSKLLLPLHANKYVLTKLYMTDIILGISPPKISRRSNCMLAASAET
jgi:hypothetical protein